MKKLVILSIVIGLSFSACSKGVDTSERDYNRAVNASKEAHQGLNRE